MPEEEVIKTLATLASQQGEISISSLQRVLNKPSTGLQVFLSSLQNVLNLEGYVVVAFDEATERITLNEPLLRQQFALNNLRSTIARIKHSLIQIILLVSGLTFMHYTVLHEEN